MHSSVAKLVHDAYDTSLINIRGCDRQKSISCCTVQMSVPIAVADVMSMLTSTSSETTAVLLAMMPKLECCCLSILYVDVLHNSKSEHVPPFTFYCCMKQHVVVKLTVVLVV